MQNYKIYSTGKIIHLVEAASTGESSFIFVFNNKDQANKFITALEKIQKNSKSPASLEELISGLNYDTLINHKDLEIMEAANNQLPGFYRSAHKDNVNKIYLGTSFS